jgi:Ca-activated chloride channel homolog
MECYSSQHLITVNQPIQHMKTTLFMISTVLLFSLSFSVPDRVITGTVISADHGTPLVGVHVLLQGSLITTTTNAGGQYSLSVPSSGGTLVFSFAGFKPQAIRIGASHVIHVSLHPEQQALQEVITGYPTRMEHKSIRHSIDYAAPSPGGYWENQPQWNTEEYDGINENIFHDALRNPLSTFSIDVDAASYSNMRRFINNSQRPPKDAVRIEELINYFDYNYPQPKDEHPFAIITEISTAPWNRKHKLVHIGLQGKRLPNENLPPANLVFLIDVSGSMNMPNKLPLLKASFTMLVQELRPKDQVAIVVYAGAAGRVLEPTSGAHKERIIQAIDRLEAGGSTAGGAGIRLAYKIARENFTAGGNNRIILATDGDFNVGESSNASMERLIEEERKSGVYLTVLGFGMGNYKDSKMETLSNKGNGNYAYIDTINEAQKVLVNEFGGTLFTIAKDVKLQIEFNPARVRAYRLIGYENRLLKNEDFNNDTKDAGDLGSGHTVTALYEIIPADVDSEFFPVDPLKYQKITVDPAALRTKELMSVKFRYKKPDSETSRLIVHPLTDNQVALEKTSDNFRWSAAVAAFGMLLRESEFLNGYSPEEIIPLAEGARGKDLNGYRIEFITLMKSCQLMARAN